jgi:hypothetical protein
VLAKQAQDLQPLHLRQHAIEYDRVEARRRAGMKRVRAIGDTHHGMTEITQPTLDEIGNVRIIFRKEDTHDLSSPAEALRLAKAYAGSSSAPADVTAAIG